MLIAMTVGNAADAGVQLQHVSRSAAGTSKCGARYVTLRMIQHVWAKESRNIYLGNEALKLVWK